MWFRIALLAAIATPVMHTVVLMISGQNAVVEPISSLSRSEWRELQTLGLLLFAVSHVVLAFALTGLGNGRLWTVGRSLLMAGGLVLVYIAFYFILADTATLRGPDANDPLGALASIIGIAMGALQRGFDAASKKLGRFNLACLVVWLALIPPILFVDETWLGLYERITGVVYVAWVIGISFLAGRLRGSASDTAQSSS